MVIACRPCSPRWLGARRRGLLVATLIGSCSVSAAFFDVGAEPISSSSLGACRERFERAPAERDSSLCFYEVARRFNRWDEAAALLEDIRRRFPGAHWATLHLAYVEASRGSGRVEALLRQAADGFAESGELRGEVGARANLLLLMMRQGRSKDASVQAERVRDIGERAGEPEVSVSARTNYALYLASSMRDLPRAYRILRRAEAAVLSGHSYWIKFRFINALSTVAQGLGRLKEARGYLRELRMLTEEAGDERGVTYARVERVHVLIEELEILPREEARREAVAFVEETVRRVAKLGDRAQESQARLQAAILRFREASSRAVVREHLERCVEIAKATTTELDRMSCLGRLALAVAPGNPERASALMDEAMSVAAAQENVSRSADVWRARAALAWRLEAPAEAVAVALSGLNTIEVIRNLQPPGTGRIGAFSRWTSDYHALAGRLLQADPAKRASGAKGANEGRALAFEVMERMRARGLLDELDVDRGGSDRPEVEPLAKKRREILQAIARTQRLMLAPALPSRRRTELRAELEQHELTAEELREKLWKATGGAERYRPPVFATVEQVQAELGAEEAMLLYQLGLRTNLRGDFGGGAWLWVITRSSAAVHRIPDRLELEDKIPAFAGLFSRREGRSSPAARRLYEDLVADGLRSLPPGVRRLIVVPDGRLHQLPFAALESADGVPLAARYALSSAPSATFWLERRRRAPPPSGERRLLAFVDPQRELDGEGVSERDLGGFSGELERLPHARIEGRTAVERLGGESYLRVGPHATEATFKRVAREPYRVIHLGTHALVDDISPERSAVVLGAGSGEEDGLLQAREIVDLDLSGRVVVLASCRSAGGAVRSGEGVLSLSRAFLVAGAQAVVGSRWPLRDDDAERFFETFYRGVSRGESLSDAMHRAQREAIEDGRPPAAWAGLVIVGAGATVPFPGGSEAPARPGFVVFVVLSTGLVVLLLGFALRGRRRLRARAAERGGASP